MGRPPLCTHLPALQAKNERNYHIFYELLAGLPAQLRQAFSLQEAETYYYLNQGGNCEILGKSDADDFRRLLAAMEVLGFSGEDQDSIFRILASILHLGNVYFEKYETDAQEVASVVSAREIQAVAELLQISPEGLQKAITFKVTETMREKIFTPLTVESAVDARDAIAKVLYALLFSWLITRVNALVSPHQDMLSIAILDIYGFEVALRVCVRGRGHKASSLAFLCLWRNHYQGPLPLLFSLLSSTIFFAYPHCQALSEASGCQTLCWATRGTLERTRPGTFS